MADRVEPTEVLAQLNQMGFCGVTTEQLRDFVSDLKKLMKYDIHQCTCAKKQCKLLNTELVTEPSNVQSPCGLMRADDTLTRNQDVKMRGEKHTQKDESSSNVLGKPGRSLASDYNTQVKVKQTRKSNGGKSHQTKCVDDQRDLQRPRSSFIRPWRLQTPTTQRRSDPVALYHKYQTIWQQQKLPGDNRHADLRWYVRERMLGDPHSLPASQTSTERLSKHS